MSPARRRVIGVVVAVVVAAGLATAAVLPRSGETNAGSSGCGDGGWERLRSVGVPVSVAAIDARSGWMVGGAFVGGHSRTFAARWTHGRWEVTPTANVGPSFNLLNDVSADRRDHAWAVGTYFDVRKVGRTLIERWDGTVWTRVETPDPWREDAQLLGVTGGPGQAWAVGSVLKAGRPAALIERWDGRRWRIAQGPDVGTSTLVSVSGWDRDVWAVGRTIDADGRSRPLIERWDGRRWTSVDIPDVTGWLASVAVAGPDRAWAVGGGAGKAGAAPLVLGWDGSAWTQVPVEGVGAGALASVDARGTRAWAVGSVARGASADPLVVRSGGTTWTAVRPPAAGRPTAVDIADDAVWLAGVVSDVDGLSTPAIFRCDVSA